MRNIVLLGLLICSLIACKENKESNEQTNSEKKSFIENESSNQKTTEPISVVKFDINKLPISDKNIGDFPFFTTPEGSKYMNNAKPKDFDFMVFVSPTDIFEVEGKTMKAYVYEDDDSDKEISNRYLLRSYEDAILNAGGVKIYEGKLEGERLKKYEELCTYRGSEGSIDIWNNPVITYAIRRNDGNVYIAIDKTTYGSSISIQMVQEKGFEQTIQAVKSEKIEKDLAEIGKSILQINFDTNKATLKQDGIKAVNEIIKALKNMPSIKISINGYTDNTGTKEHNLKLSKERAITVKEELIKAGIDSTRLNSNGFGQDSPIAENTSEKGRTQNRRVELVKK